MGRIWLSYVYMSRFVCDFMLFGSLHAGLAVEAFLAL